MSALKFGGEWVLARDEVLVSDGHEQQYLYMVVNGQVGIYKADDQGTNQQIASLGVGAAFGEMASYRPEGDCWYLPLIGVDPAHQGRGLGSMMLKHALNIIDEKGLPAFLESSNPANISLYERHGFEVVGRIQVGSSPAVHPMHRAPVS